MQGIQTVAVTGASGVVGRHVLQFAEKEGLRCVTASRSSPSYLPESFKWQSWDLDRWLELDELDTLFGNVDALLHIGALTPRKNTSIGYRDLFNTNVGSCLNLGLWALQKEIPVVYLSTSTAYADASESKIKEDAPMSCTGESLGGFYGITKFLGEQVLTGLTTEGLNLCILRPSSIYGAGMANDQMIPIFLNAALKDEDITIAVHPESKVNLIHAMDVVEAMFAALRHGTNKVYNVASPEQISILNVAQTVIRTCEGSRSEIIQEYEISSAPFNRFNLDCSAAHKDLNFMANIDLEEGLKLMKEEMSENSNIRSL